MKENQLKRDSILSMAQGAIEEKVDYEVSRVIDNILDHAHDRYHVSKDMFVTFLDKMIPEITFDEIIQFAEDGILTKSTIERKRIEMIKNRDEIHK